MLVIFLVLVILGLLAAVAYPLIRGSSSDEEDDGFSQDPHLQELLSQKEATYSALKELDFDYGTGKLSEDDYRELRDRYKAKAVSVLKEIDEVEKGDSIESRIEQAVEELRGHVRSGGQQAPAVSGVACVQCGVLNNPEDKFCGSCGQSLAEQRKGNVCRKCGLGYQKGDKFCSGCGEALVATG